MKIWIDGDACPVVIKEILYRAAQRREIPLTLVANQPIQIPQSPHIDFLLVEGGFDVADSEIVNRVTAGDLVITADIPLAAQVVAKEALALDPRGTLYSEKNIGDRLQLRDMMATLRDTGVEAGGPPPFKAKDRQTFANQLDRLLTQSNR